MNHDNRFQVGLKGTGYVLLTKGAGKRMVDVYEIKRGNKAKKLVNDFISFFENEYVIRHDAEGDLSLGEKAEEQIIYNWDGSVLSDLSKKEGVLDAAK